ncbi:Brain-Specific Serine Protease 4 [Manis pentadactyla]|nr:Brain-Specific Serine Protease 4 [Manis pentadactyla]
MATTRLVISSVIPGYRRLAPVSVGRKREFAHKKPRCHIEWCWQKPKVSHQKLIRGFSFCHLVPIAHAVWLLSREAALAVSTVSRPPVCNRKNQVNRTSFRESDSADSNSAHLSEVLRPFPAQISEEVRAHDFVTFYNKF